MGEEIWKPVVGWEGLYEVSNVGNIRSLMTNPPRLRKQIVERSGHRRVQLAKGGRLTGYMVHRLVLQAFVGDADLGQTDCAHLNGDPTDNRVENLKWTTRTENMSHKLLHGTLYQGSRTLSKLTEEQVIQLRTDYATGMKMREILAKYPLAESSLRRIIKGQEWRHVDMCGLPIHEKHDRGQKVSHLIEHIKKLERRVVHLEQLFLDGNASINDTTNEG